MCKLCINEPKRKNETVNLPQNVKYADYDYNIDKETSMILTLTSDNKLKQKNNVPGKAERTENIITNEELAEKLKKFSEVTSPDKQIVYLKADINASYDNVLQVLDYDQNLPVIVPLPEPSEMIIPMLH